MSSNCWDCKELIEQVDKLRRVIVAYDIPHPTTAEDTEIHRKMQSLLGFIDNKIL